MTANKALKSQIMEEVEAAIDHMLENSPPGTEITLSEIEALVREAKAKIEGSLTQALVSEVTENELERSGICRACGGRLRNKGIHDKTVQSEHGTVEIQRQYQHCPQCEQGFFPPG